MTSRIILSVMAVMVGVLSIAPYLYAYFFVGPSPYEGEKLHYFYQDSELRYLSRIRDITEGYWPVASPIFHEYKDSARTQQPFGEGVYALLALGQSEFLPLILLLTKFLFPAILFLILYLISYRLLVDTGAITRVVCSSLAILYSFVIAQGIGAFRRGFLFKLLQMEYVEPVLSIWTRSVNPIVGGLLLFSVLLLSVRLRDRFSWRYAIALGVLVGLSSAYIFSLVITMFILIILGLFFVLYKEWNKFLILAVAAVVSIGINVGYVWSILTQSSSGTSLEKNGLFYTHEIVVNNGILLATGLFLLAFGFSVWRSNPSDVGKKTWVRFSVAVLLGSFFAYSHQFFTGVAIWPSHFVQYSDPLVLLVILLSVIAILHSLFTNIAVFKKNQQMVFSFFTYSISAAIGFLVVVQLVSISSVHEWENRYLTDQRYLPILTWLNDAHPSGDCVVLRMPSKDESVHSYRFEISDYITAYTACDSYHSHYVFMAIPEERILHNYIAYLRIQGVTASTISDYLVTNEREWQDLFFQDWVEKFAHRDLRFLNAIAEPGQVEQYLSKTPGMIREAFIQSLEVPLVEWLSVYQLDYIIYDISLALKSFPADLGVVVYEANGIQLIKFDHQGE